MKFCKLSSALLTLFAASLSASTALACAFHNFEPQITVVDQLLASEEIALAYPTFDDALRYDPLASIGSDLEDVEIPQRVDAATIEKFSQNPDGYVLFARESYGKWTRMANVDGDMVEVFDDILSRLDRWRAGDDADRMVYFATKLGHQDIRVHRLALRELDRIDYAQLRQLELNISVEAIMSRMVVLSDPYLQPIQILMLGMTGGSDWGALLKSGLDEQSDEAGAAFGAYATAYIEVVGAEAARHVARNFVSKSSLSTNARTLAAQALALQGSLADAALSETIRQEVAAALKADPTLAPIIAHQFGQYEDWTHKVALWAAIRTNPELTLADRISVLQYLMQADQAASAISDASAGRTTAVGGFTSLEPIRN